MNYNYTVERFKLSDWEDINVREEAKDDFEILKKEIIYNEIFTNGAPTFTFRCNNKVLAVYGFSYGGMYTYYPFIVADKELHKHTRKLVALIYEYFSLYVPKNCRRLEAYCDIMDKKAMRLAQHFGFSIIGIRHYASAKGHDQAIMERLTFTDPRKEK